MIHSRRSLEGYVLIDHTDSPGVTEHDLRQAGLDPSRFPKLVGGTKLERPTSTCTHCNRVVVLNPLRTRPRHNCPYCDHYVCDNPSCVLMAEGLILHQPVAAQLDAAMVAATLTAKDTD